jgi:hypothetical protein
MASRLLRLAVLALALATAACTAADNRHYTHNLVGGTTR